MSSDELAYNKKTGLGRIFFYIICGIVALLLVIVSFATIMTRSNSKPPILFGYGLCLSTSDSVDGTVKNGSLVVVKNLNPSELKVGDTITYIGGYNAQKNTIVKTNKIVEIETTDKKCLLKTNDEDSEIINENALIGKASFSIPTLGNLFLFIKTPIGLIVCVALPLLFLLIFEIVNLIRLSKNPKEEEDVLEGNLASYMRIDRDDEDTDIFGEAIISKDISSNISKNYLFEHQDEKLEVVESRSPFASLSYKKSNITESQVNSNSIYSTKEFQLPEIQKALAGLELPLPRTDVTPLVSKSTDFSASINVDTTNSFNIEGIAVKVQSDAVKLKIDNDTISRDIDITVTDEYTNVIVNSDDYEVNFAFLKHQMDKEKKVIIQKKSKV